MLSFALFGPLDPDPVERRRPRRRGDGRVDSAPRPRSASGAADVMPIFDTPDPVALEISVPAGLVSSSTWDEPRVEVEVTPLRGDDGSRQAADETRVEADGRGRAGTRSSYRRAEAGGAVRLPRPEPRAPRSRSAARRAPTSSSRRRAPTSRPAGRSARSTVRSASGDASLGDTTGARRSPPRAATSRRARSHGPLTSKSRLRRRRRRASSRAGSRSARSRATCASARPTDAVSREQPSRATSSSSRSARGVRVSAVSGDVSSRGATRARALDRRAVGQRDGAAPTSTSADRPRRRGRPAGRAPGPHRQRRRPHLARDDARRLAAPRP